MTRRRLVLIIAGSLVVLAVGRLRGLGLYNRTLIVVDGDHGEVFGEHGEFGT